MNREIQKEINDNILKESQNDKDKNITSYYPLSEREQIDSRINSNILSLQNSAFKNFKNEPANAYM